MENKRFAVTRSDEEWRRLLTPEQYQVMRGHGTEAPGSCALNHEKRRGTFVCAGCEQPLFVSQTKFESGTGWPSFNDPVPGSVETSADQSYGMVRTEVHCSRCGSHLGACLRGRAASDASALLHQRRRHELPAGVTAQLHGWRPALRRRCVIPAEERSERSPDEALAKSGTGRDPGLRFAPSGLQIRMSESR